MVLGVMPLQPNKSKSFQPRRPRLSFAVHDVEATANDNNRTTERICIRKLVEKQISERQHPDDLQERIGRQRSRRRFSVGQDDQIVAKTAKKNRVSAVAQSETMFPG
jgi:hypothetical protein